MTKLIPDHISIDRVIRKSERMSYEEGKKEEIYFVL
jgi:hypothetical protein